MNPDMLFLGNSHFGGDILKYTLAPSQSLKTLTPNDSVVTVGEDINSFKTPEGGLSGQLAIPNGLSADSRWSVTIDGTSEVAAFDAQIFDAKKWHQNACSGCTATFGGSVYSVSPTCNIYESILATLCNRIVIVSAIVVKVTGTNKTFDIPLEISKRNFTTSSVDTIDLQNFEGTTNNSIADTIVVPLMGQNARLDGETAWTFKAIPAGVKIRLTIIISAMA